MKKIFSKIKRKNVSILKIHLKNKMRKKCIFIYFSEKRSRIRKRSRNHRFREDIIEIEK